MGMSRPRRRSDAHAPTPLVRTVLGVHTALTTGLALVLVANPGARARRGDYADFLAAFRPVDAVMSRVAPPLFLTTAASGVAAAAGTVRPDPQGSVLRLVSAALVGAAIRSTVTVNLPLNEQIRSFDEHDEPAGWQDVRARWDRAHHRRTVLVGAAAVAAVAASPAVRSRLSLR